MILRFRSWLHRITAPKSTHLPFCTRCGKVYKRGQKHTVVSFLHDECEAKK